MAEGKETRQFNGEWYVMEESLTADLALVKAWKADKAGNLLFRKTARNFNPLAAMAGEVCVVEVEEIVETGELDPTRFTCRVSTCIASCTTRTRKNASKNAR